MMTYARGGGLAAIFLLAAGLVSAQEAAPPGETDKGWLKLLSRSSSHPSLELPRWAPSNSSRAKFLAARRMRRWRRLNA